MTEIWNENIVNWCKIKTGNLILPNLTPGKHIPSGRVQNSCFPQGKEDKEGQKEWPDIEEGSEAELKGELI